MMGLALKQREMKMRDVVPKWRNEECCSITYLITIMFQIKGIGELLEGLIPYSHRHFSRIDRHVRSTFLLDYTLTGMSVIEPEINAKEREEDESLMHSDVKDMDDMILTENFDSEQKQTSEEPKVSSKKRKSKKSKESSSKKVRGVAYTKVDAISLQA